MDFLGFSSRSWENSLEKSGTFSEKSFHITDSDSQSSHRRCMCKKKKKKILRLHSFFQVFDSMHRGKREQMLQTYDFSKENVTIVVILYKKKNNNKKQKQWFTHLMLTLTFFYIVTWIMQGDTLAPYLFIICLDYVLRTSIDLIKENGYTFKRQELDNILQKLSQTQTTQMIYCFS